MIIVIGLTGSFSTGKSLAASYFKSFGAKVINTDDIAHDLLKKGGICYKKVLKEFGTEITAGLSIDRKKLAEIVFKDIKKLKKLESIVHPKVEKEVIRKIRSLKKKCRNGIIVVEVPLLFESGIDKIADYTVVVKSRLDQQIERALRKFKISRSEAMRRIKAQMPLKDKILLADIIIDNTKNKILLKKEVEKICKNMLRRIKN